MHSLQRLKEITSELEDLEEELEHQRAIFEAIFKAAPDGILIVDEHGTMTEMNPAMERIFGYREKELIGKQVEILIPDSLRNKHTELRVAYHNNPELRCGVSVIGLKSDGTEVPVNIALAPIQVNGFAGTVAVVRDLTEQ